MSDHVVALKYKTAAKFRSVSFLLLTCLFVMLFASGCGHIELYQGLSEEEANEMMVLLSQNGIKVNKKKIVFQNEVSYAVEVREPDMIKARSLLVQNHLPRKKEAGLTGVYKEKGLIPTPDEQKARFLLALKGEIINSLERIPQIVDADVVLNIPTKSEFASAEEQKLQRPTASIVVRIKPDQMGEEAITEPKIQQFVANAVEGMNPRDVTVIISYLMSEERVIRPGDVKTLPSQMTDFSQPAAIPQSQIAAPQSSPSEELMGLKLDPASKGRLRIYLLVFFLLLMVLSSGLIIAIVQASRLRRRLAALQGPVDEHPAIDGQVLEEGPPRLGGGGDEL